MYEQSTRESTSRDFPAMLVGFVSLELEIDKTNQDSWKSKADTTETLIYIRTQEVVVAAV
jgi:hypothetical protein